MSLLCGDQRLAARPQARRIPGNSTCLDWKLPLPAVQRGRGGKRRNRRAPPLAGVLRTHPRARARSRLRRASRILPRGRKGWGRSFRGGRPGVARRSMRRPGSGGLRHGGGRIGCTQRRRAAYPTTTILARGILKYSVGRQRARGTGRTRRAWRRRARIPTDRRDRGSTNCRGLRRYAR